MTGAQQRELLAAAVADPLMGNAGPKLDLILPALDGATSCEEAQTRLADAAAVERRRMRTLRAVRLTLRTSADTVYWDGPVLCLAGGAGTAADWRAAVAVLRQAIAADLVADVLLDGRSWSEGPPAE
jgi:hypothetical protein